MHPIPVANNGHECRTVQYTEYVEFPFDLGEASGNVLAFVLRVACLREESSG